VRVVGFVEREGMGGEGEGSWARRDGTGWDGMGCCVGGWVEGENVRAEGQGGRYYSGGEETGLRSNVRRRVGRGEIGKIKIDIYIAKAKSPISLVPGLVPLEVIRLIVRRREQGKPQYESAKTTVTFLPSFLASLPPLPLLSVKTDFDTK